MGKYTMSEDAYTGVKDDATKGGTQKVTSGAEERLRQGKGLDPLVDPKGPAHLGPIRRSLPRFDKDEKTGLWLMTLGVPIDEETLLDTTGSMGENVDIAFEVLLHSYKMLTGGSKPVLGRYDVQIATSIFNDVDDDQRTSHVLCRTQFEMAEKIAIQMTLLVPGHQGCGNGKEDPQFGIFAASYLTDAAINRWGLKGYHYTVSDEPVASRINLQWLKKIFGDDVLDWVKQNGYDFDVRHLPDTQQAVMDLQKRKHAFFLQVGDRPDVKEQWMDLYGADHFVMLPGGTTRYLHCVKAVIAGLTEGVLDLGSAADFLREHEITARDAELIVRSVAHIPLGAQTFFPNFNKLPKAGDFFRDKTELWPVDQSEIGKAEAESSDHSKTGPNWL